MRMMMYIADRALLEENFDDHQAAAMGADFAADLACYERFHRQRCIYVFCGHTALKIISAAI